MKTIHYNELNPAFFNYLEPDILVEKIIKNVRIRGDKALKEYTLKFDQVDLRDFRVDPDRITRQQMLSEASISMLNKTAENIRLFAERQMKQIADFSFEITPGVRTGQTVHPIETVGVYVPGGRYPLISSLLMCAIPAQVAGVQRIIACTPPGTEKDLSEHLLAAARIADINEVYTVGGAQAIAAMAYGTESIPAVDKIVGPGNQYVTAAKRAVYGKVGIDFLAGPTEILIIGDSYANPAYIAADLLGQAEHDIDAVPILLTDSELLAKRVKEELKRQIPALRTSEIASESIRNNGTIVICPSLDEAVLVANRKAPEHLEVQVRQPDRISNRLTNYGTLFIGEKTNEALGDYSSGLNHTLPTNASARYTGGLSVFDFIKISTTLETSQQGFESIGPLAAAMASLEGLEAHRNSVDIRLKPQ